MVTMIRSEAQINEVLDKCAAQEDEGGSKWPGMTYEQGVRAAIEWLTQNYSSNPMDE